MGHDVFFHTSEASGVILISTAPGFASGPYAALLENGNFEIGGAQFGAYSEVAKIRLTPSEIAIGSGGLLSAGSIHLTPGLGDINGYIYIEGTLRIATGAGAGKVLTSDISGDATWQAPAGGGSKFADDVGDGINTDLVVNHALGTTDVIVAVKRVAAPYDVVFPDVEITDANNVTLIFGAVPTLDEYRCVVIG
jgi:hypothetical protein